MARTIHMLSAVVESRISGFLSGVERAKTATRDLRMAVSDFVNSVNAAGTRIAAGLTAATAGVTKMAFNFQTAMIPLRGVLAHLTDVEFAKFERGLRDLAIKTGRSVDELSKGANDFLQSGATADEALTAMAATARLVVAGQAEMGSATRLTTNIVNAYGMKWSDATGLMDKFFKASDDGIGSIEEWAVALPTFTGVASKLNVPLDTLLGQFASITKGTKSASVAATSLRAFMDAMTSGQEELELIFEKWGGPEEAIRKLGLQAVAEHIHKVTGGSQTELQRLLGRQEAVTAAIEITGKNAERTRQFIDNVAKSAGESTKRMELAQNAPVEKFKQSWQAIRDVVLSVGTAVGDKVVELTKGIREFIEANKGEIAEQTVATLTKFVEVGQSVVQFFTEHKESARQAAETFNRWFGWILKYLSESPRLVASLVALRVVGFLGLTGVLRSLIALITTAGLAALRSMASGFGFLAGASRAAATSVSADMTKVSAATATASAAVNRTSAFFAATAAAGRTASGEVTKTGVAATVAGGKVSRFGNALGSVATSLTPMIGKLGIFGLVATAITSIGEAAASTSKSVREFQDTMERGQRLRNQIGQGGRERIDNAKTDEGKVAAIDEQLELLKQMQRGAESNSTKSRADWETIAGVSDKQGWGEKMKARSLDRVTRWAGRSAWSLLGKDVGADPLDAAKKSMDEAKADARNIQDQIAQLEKEKRQLQLDITRKVADEVKKPAGALITNRAGATGPLDPGFRDSDFKKQFEQRLDGFAFKDQKSSAADTRLTAIQRKTFNEAHPGAEELRKFLALAAKDSNVSVGQLMEFAKTLKLTDAAVGELTGRFQELRNIKFENPQQLTDAMLKLADDTFLLDEAGKKADEKAKADFEKQQQAKKEQEEAARDIGDFFKDIRQRAVSSVEDLPDNAAAAGLREKAEFFVEEFQNKAYVLEQSLANGSMSVDQFNRSMTDLRNEADASAAALQREIDAEKRRRLLRGDFSLLDPRKALEDRIISFRMQQFNQGIDSMFRRMFPFADQLGKTTDNFINLNNGIQNFGNTLQNFGTIGAEKVSESWNQITSWMNSRAGQIASVEAQIQLLLQNLGLMGNNSFNYKGMQIRKQLDSLYDILDALMAQAPPTFIDTSGSGIFHDPGLQTTQQQQTNNISLSFPNLDKLTNADARQILQVVNLELQRAGHQRVF